MYYLKNLERLTKALGSLLMKPPLMDAAFGLESGHSVGT